MDMRAAMSAVRVAWSDADVCRVARAFLAECSWELEVGKERISIPPETELLVYSAAVIVSEHGFGDHIEAIVYLGAERTKCGTFPVHGVLRLYLDPTGGMITEDRYSRGGWFGRT